MIRKLYVWMLLPAGVLVGLIASGRIVLYAQDRGGADRRDSGRAVLPEPVLPREREQFRDPFDGPASLPRTMAAPATGSVQDVLLRPFHFPFTRPTSLSQVCIHLKQALGVPVVLDVAALGRQSVDADATVQLELDGVRLKTGLKLLLDQVGLTYHVVPEDNLLIITDREGSEDPLDRIWAELRAIHRDLHEVQDAVDDLGDTLYGDNDLGPRVRQPTIIEEKPDGEPFAPEEPGGVRKKPENPGREPGRMQGPAPAPRSLPARVPLANPGRAL